MEPSKEVNEQPQEPQEYDVTYLFLKCGAAKNKRGFLAEPRVDEHGNHGIFLKEVWKGSTAHRVGANHLMYFYLSDRLAWRSTTELFKYKTILCSARQTKKL
jgi:hypothetical protein